MTRPVEERELHLYVDDQLPTMRRAAVELHLRLHPADADRVRAYRQQNELLRRLGTALEALPPLEAQLVPLLRRKLRGVSWQRFRPRLAAAAAMALAVALGAGGAELYNGYNGETTHAPPPAAPGFADIATRAHILYASAGEPMEFGADGAAQLGSQLDQRLGTPLRLPDLSQKGFSLVGGRFLPGAGGATAQLVYRDKGGRLITLFLGGRAEPQARGGDRQPVGLYTWLDGSLNVAVVGGVGGDELSSIAEAAQRSLMSAEPPPVKTERPPQPQPQNRPPDASKT